MGKPAGAVMGDRSRGEHPRSAQNARLAAAIEAVLRVERPLHHRTIWSRVGEEDSGIFELFDTDAYYTRLRAEARFVSVGKGYWTLNGQEGPSCEAG